MNEPQRHAITPELGFEEYRLWEDIEFFVAAKRAAPIESVSYAVEFSLYEVVGWAGDTGFRRPGAALFPKKDTLDANDPTDDAALSEPYLHGFVKWDGCSDWHFDAQDELMLHFCGKRQAMRLGTLMERLYDLAAELMPEHAYMFVD